MESKTTARSENGRAEALGRKAWRDGMTCDPHLVGIPVDMQTAWRFGWMSEEQISRLLMQKGSARD